MKVLIAIPVMLVLTLLSVPFIIIGLGHAFSGDADGLARWVERCPVVWWLDWVEAA